MREAKFSHYSGGVSMHYTGGRALSLLNNLEFVKKALAAVTPTGLGKLFIGEAKAHLVADQLILG